MTNTNLLDRLFGWWYFLAAPPPVADEAPLYMRERIRRARLLSIIQLLLLVGSLSAMFQGDLTSLVLSGCVAVVEIVCIILNRVGRTMTAGIIVLTVHEVVLILGFVGGILAHGGIKGTDLISLIFLIYPDMIAIALFPSLVAIIFSLFNCVIIALGIALLPKAPDVVIYLHSTTLLSLYIQLLSPQLLIILISFSWASNANQEMKRADQAEEINKLALELSTQQQEALQDKQRLEDSIQQIIQVHTQVANGDFNARVPLDSQNVLWSVAGSLNNLLVRIQRWRYEIQLQQRVERAIQQVASEIQQAKRQKTPLRISKTGTVLDILLAEFADVLSEHSTSTPKSANFSSTSSVQDFPKLDSSR